MPQSKNRKREYMRQYMRRKRAKSSQIVHSSGTNIVSPSADKNSRNLSLLMEALHKIPDIDWSIVEYLARLNMRKDVCTAWSCAGHGNRAAPYVILGISDLALVRLLLDKLPSVESPKVDVALHAIHFREEFFDPITRLIEEITDIDTDDKVKEKVAWILTEVRRS